MGAIDPKVFGQIHHEELNQRSLLIMLRSIIKNPTTS